MSEENLPLPASYQYGFVTCRIIDSIADTSKDADNLPEAIPSKGQIIFTPKDALRKETGAATAFVKQASHKYNLHAETGQLVNSQMESAFSQLTEVSPGEFARLVPEAGVWLYAGNWTVKFSLESGTLSSFDITVTGSSTPQNPLDLVTVAPTLPSAGQVLTSILVPTPLVEGRVLGTVSGSLAWVEQTGGSGGVADWDTILNKPAVVSEGATTAEARASIGAGTSDFSGIYSSLTGIPATFPPEIGVTSTTAVAGDDSRLSDSRTPTSHKTTHAMGGSDALTPADIGAATSAQGALAASSVQPGDLNKSAVGLANVDNTSDANKPVSTAQATAISNATPTWTTISGKPAVIAEGATQSEARLAIGAAAVGAGGGLPDEHASTHAVGGTDPLTPTAIGLGNVDNTSDVNKPVSTAQQVAFNATPWVVVHNGSSWPTRPTTSRMVWWIDPAGTFGDPTDRATGDILDRAIA